MKTAKIYVGAIFFFFLAIRKREKDTVIMQRQSGRQAVWPVVPGAEVSYLHILFS